MMIFGGKSLPELAGLVSKFWMPPQVFGNLNGKLKLKDISYFPRYLSIFGCDNTPSAEPAAPGRIQRLGRGTPGTGLCDVPSLFEDCLVGLVV
jgi:hypothetical protein